MTKRPISLEDYQSRLRLTFTEDGIARGRQFKPKMGDIVISPYGKCGTTWLQQMAHTLRTRGDMVFDDISRVCPWIEMAHDLALDLSLQQKASPRIFKSHRDYEGVPKGCRYIVSFRDPKDALVSMYRFMEGWFFEPGSISITEFAEGDYLRSEGLDYWTHFSSWWRQRENSNVLLLTYEGMRNNLDNAIRRVANFMDIELDGQLLDITRKHTSFDFMLAHCDRFDDKLMREHAEKVADIPPGSDSAKVRKGEVGAYRYELTPRLSEALDRYWDKLIFKEFGLRSYDDVLGLL